MINNNRYFYVMSYKFPQNEEELLALDGDSDEIESKRFETVAVWLEAKTLLEELAQEETVSIDEARKRVEDAEKIKKMIEPFDLIYMKGHRLVAQPSSQNLAPKTKNTLFRIILDMTQAIIDAPDSALNEPYAAAENLLKKLETKGLGKGIKAKTLGNYLKEANALRD